MANTENINRLIDHLKADGGRRFLMTNFTSDLTSGYGFEAKRYDACGTALCLAGWSNLLRITDAGIDPKSLDEARFGEEFRSIGAASDWLGYEKIAPLFMMMGDDDRYEFDDLPDDTRLRAGIKVLEILRDENRVAWDEAIAFAQEGGSDA